MVLNWKIHRSIIILVSIVSALGLLGFLNMFGYPLTYKIFSGITVAHVLGIAQIYILYAMWKHYV